MNTQVKNQVSIKQLITDLDNGLTRYTKDDFGNGSIEAKYSLTKTQVASIFKHDKLKGKKVKGKTRKTDNVELIDDTVEVQVVSEINTSFDPLELVQESLNQ